MMKRFLILTAGILILPHVLHAAGSAATEKEYQQVRTIALRDPRVRAAYRDADRRLDAKMIQIDPSLEPYVKSKAAAREGTPAPKATPPAKPAASKPAPAKNTHVVAKGETLGGIAARHHVSVAALKSANHIQDERKLRVGQVLTIPAGKDAPEPKDEGLWSRLKGRS